MKHFYQDIQLGQLMPVYLFFGDEALLIDEALIALARAIDPEDSGWQRELFDGEEAAPGLVAAAAAQGSLFGGRRLVVAKNISWLERKEKKGDSGRGKDGAKSGKDVAAGTAKSGKDAVDETAPLLAYLQDANPGACLALTARGNVDKRRKLVQLIQKKGRLIECATPKGAERDMWLAQRFKAAGFRAERQALSYIGFSTVNLSQMAAEVDKLCHYCADKGEITLADAEAVVAKSSLATIFELTDAAAAKNAAKACAYYRQLRRQGEEEQKIFAMLAAQFRNLLLAQDLLAQGCRADEVASRLSLHPFVAEKCSRACRAFTQRQLIKALEMLLAADIAQKSGQGDMDDLLEMSILRICAMP